MRAAANLLSVRCRIRARSRPATRSTAAAASGGVIDDEAIDAIADDLWQRSRAQRYTGVPKASDSMATSPNGSGQFDSITVASASPINSSRSR